MPLPEPGETVLGKYQIDRRLGAGGMGTVFAAHDVRLGGLVALKFLLPELAARPDIAQRFVQEARAGWSLTSAHVAKVHDIEKFGEVPFIVMDHLEGETLAACLARRGRLPVDEAIDFVLQACEPLNEAHLLGPVSETSSVFASRLPRSALRRVAFDPRPTLPRPISPPTNPAQTHVLATRSGPRHTSPMTPSAPRALHRAATRPIPRLRRGAARGSSSTEGLVPARGPAPRAPGSSKATKDGLRRLRHAIAMACDPRVERLDPG